MVDEMSGSENGITPKIGREVDNIRDRATSKM